MNKKVIALAIILTITGSTFIAWGQDESEAQADTNIDVFLIAGQSNAAYSWRVIPDEAAPVCSYGTAYYFGNDTAPVLYSDWDSDAEYGIYDIVNEDGSAKLGGLEQAFSATYIEKTGNKVCTINVAVGGSKMKEWSVNEVYYVWSQEVFTKALAALVDAGFTPQTKGLIWLQGESDPTWTIDGYKNRFMTMFNSMNHTGLESIGYFNDDYTLDYAIISLVRQHRGQNSCMAQIQLDAEHDNVKLGCIICDQFNYENGLLYNDDTHYTQLGRNIVAVDLAENYVRLFG